MHAVSCFKCRKAGPMCDDWYTAGEEAQDAGWTQPGVVDGERVWLCPACQEGDDDDSGND